MSVITRPDHERLVISLRAAARSLSAGRATRDHDSTITELVRAAVDMIPNADGGGISHVASDTVWSSHATSEEIYELDQLQAGLGQGPCVTAAMHAPPTGIVLARDLAGPDAARWPRFAPEAVRAGYRSQMSIQLSLGEAPRSALNLYAHAPDAFDPAAQVTAGLFGVQAAMLLHGADHADNLSNALKSRDTIGQAKGILIERFTVDDDEAFQMLVRASQDTNVKLVDVARWLIADAIGRTGRPAPDGHPSVVPPTSSRADRPFA